MAANSQLSEQALRAYAYLTASFRTKENSADIVDCLLPFISAAILKDPTEPVDVERVRVNLADFGLDIPLYAIEQMLPRLQRDGIVEWNDVAKRHIPNTQTAKTKSSLPQLPEAFDSLEELLSGYAAALDVEEPPLSANWADALISFLKDRYAGRNVKVFKADGVMSSASPEIQSVIVGLFVQDCATNNLEAFSSIEKIYTGIQIEDFVQNIQSLGQSSDYGELWVFYDTSVLLRLLGTSGKLLQNASLEMHNTLQSLGAKTYYLSQNGNEVENILGTLSSAYERGQEIYNETADALTDGEITIGDIRDLAGTFESRLSMLNIFPFIYDYNSRKIEEKFQIDEVEFSEALKSAALRRERIYSVQNALNDAGAVNLMFRLRKGRPARNIGDAKVIFVSRNSLLQREARNFAIRHTDTYDESSIPPVLTNGQITTAAWLADSKTLQPSKLSQELLARCYAAVQPSSEWAEEFGKALEEFKSENPEVVADRANAILFLSAARKAARETTFNDPTLLKKANTVEIFRRAAEEARLAEVERERKSIEERERIKVEHQEALAVAENQWEANATQRAEIARAAGLEEAAGANQSRLERRGEQFAKRVVMGLQALTILSLSGILLLGPSLGEPGSIFRACAWVAVGIVTILAISDLVGISIVRRFFDEVRDWLKDKYINFLAG